MVIRSIRHPRGPDKDEAERKFHKLMAKLPTKKVRADPVAALIDDFLDWT